MSKKRSQFSPEQKLSMQCFDNINYMAAYSSRLLIQLNWTISSIRRVMKVWQLNQCCVTRDG